MQDAKVLSQRDITRLQNVIGRLVQIGDALMSKNGHTRPAGPKKRRKRRTSSVVPAPTKRRGASTPAPPSPE